MDSATATPPGTGRPVRFPIAVGCIDPVPHRPRNELGAVVGADELWSPAFPDQPLQVAHDILAGEVIDRTTSMLSRSRLYAATVRSHFKRPPSLAWS
jgi:hypothetical protein